MDETTETPQVGHVHYAFKPAKTGSTADPKFELVIDDNIVLWGADPAHNRQGTPCIELQSADGQLIRQTLRKNLYMPGAEGVESFTIALHVSEITRKAEAAVGGSGGTGTLDSTMVGFLAVVPGADGEKALAIYIKNAMGCTAAASKTMAKALHKG